MQRRRAASTWAVRSVDPETKADRRTGRRVTQTITRALHSDHSPTGLHRVVQARRRIAVANCRAARPFRIRWRHHHPPRGGRARRVTAAASTIVRPRRTAPSILRRVAQIAGISSASRTRWRAAAVASGSVSIHYASARLAAAPPGSPSVAAMSRSAARSAAQSGTTLLIARNASV